jgi:RNA polymerase sigma-70 factor (ECF subfamily)
MSVIVDFNIVWEQYEQELTNFVRARLYDKSLVSDIMQEVAIKIYKNQLTPINNVRAWFYRITKNTLIDFYKQNNKTIPDELYNLELTIDDLKYEPNELHSCLVGMMTASLNKSDTDRLNISVIEQYSLKDISAKLNLTVDGSKTKLKRAKKKLSSKFFTCCSLDTDTQGSIMDFKTKNNNKCDC